VVSAATRWRLAAALAAALLVALAACHHVGPPGGGGPDGDADTETESEPESDTGECASQGADDLGGGCPPGHYCNEDHECAQDCTNDEQCQALNGDGWECNDFGMCEYTGDVGGDY
jgi:hypothetical protein